MRYLVTGATGFIGGALSRELRERGHVAVICRDGDPPSGCDVIRGSITDPTVCARAVVEHCPDVVFHLAAQAIVGHAKVDPYGTFESNVRGTYTLLEACRLYLRKSQIVPIVVASSDKAYGYLADGKLYRESDPMDGRGFYDCSKSVADMICRCYGKASSLDVAVIRAGNVYGPGDDDQTRIVPSLVRDAVSDRSLNVISDGTPVRDYLYIDDAVRAYLHVADYVRQGGSHREFNVSGGEPVSVLELAERVATQWKRLGHTRPKVVVHGSGRGDEIPYQALDTTRITETGFRPYTSLDEGLALTLRHAVEK